VNTLRGVVVDELGRRVVWVKLDLVRSWDDLQWTSGHAHEGIAS
jgi:hypothetical protein